MFDNERELLSVQMEESGRQDVTEGSYMLTLATVRRNMRSLPGRLLRTCRKSAQYLCFRP